MNITDKAIARQIISASENAGTKIPRPIAQAFTDATLLSEAAGDLAAPPEALASAVTAALACGRDPAADPEVHRNLAAAQIANRGIQQAIDGIAFNAFRQVCIAHADRLVKAWRKPFAAAASTLTAGYRRIGNVPLDDAHSILRRGDDIAAVWAQAQAADAVISDLVSGWTALGDFTRLVRSDPRYAALRLASVDYPTWAAHGLQGRRLTGWDAVRVGLTLELPTPAEYRTRIADLERGRQRATSAKPTDSRRSLIAGIPLPRSH